MEEGVVKRSIKTIKVWNLYDVISGSWFASFESEPFLEEIAVESVIQPRIKPAKIKNTITKALEKYLEVVTPKAKQRYAKKLEDMGIPLPVTSVEADSIIEVFYPFYISLLRRNGRENYRNRWC